MKKSGLKNAAVFAAFILAFVCSSGALALDATSFDPRNVSVEADSISGVPVGTIITWPVATNPEGWDEGKWLECNGQSVNPTVYPELFALTGATVPDLRGLFLRGQGGNAAGLGSIQEDAGRNVWGDIAVTPSLAGDVNVQAFGENVTESDGAFSLSTAYRTAIRDQNGDGAVTAIGIHFNASRVWGAAHTTDAIAGEFRPVNRAVRYLIRAL